MVLSSAVFVPLLAKPSLAEHFICAGHDGEEESKFF